MDLYDRIINLKFTLKNKSTGVQDEYVIRSDYEFYYPSLMNMINGGNIINTGYIRRCQYKPSIKVEYKKTNTSTPTMIDIYIDNFYMFDKSGKIVRSFNDINMEIVRIDVVMGYWEQFERENVTVASLFRFDRDDLMGHGLSLLTIDGSSLYVQTDKLPPDMRVHIHGYLGSFLEQPIDDKKTLEYGSLNETTGNTFIERCYRTIGERFNKQIYFSDKMLQLAKDKEQAFELSDVETLTMETQDSLDGCLNYLANELGLEGFCYAPVIPDGVLIFLNTEIKEVNSLSKAIKNRLKNTYWQNKLMAVYNITYNSYCTIVCPYFWYIDVFETFYFKSRYALSGLVAYYTNTDTNIDEFTCLWQDVSFATVEDINECTIVCLPTIKEKRGDDK